MADRRMMMMEWDGLGNEDEFYESFDRISSAISLDFGSSDSDEDYDDSRVSFSSCISAPPKEFLNFTTANAVVDEPEEPTSGAYDIWMAEPGSIKDRRKRLLQGMGLNSNKSLLRFTCPTFGRSISKAVPVISVEEPKQEPLPLPSPASTLLPSTLIPNLIIRPRSDADIPTAAYVDAKLRKEELLGVDSTQHLTRSPSAPSSFCHRDLLPVDSSKPFKIEGGIEGLKAIDGSRLTMSPSLCEGSFFIKNLDTGKEFIVNALDQNGMWNSLSDAQTGKQLTMEEFEKTVGHSPIVKELMRRENVARNPEGGADANDKITANAHFSKSFRSSRKRGVALLKNIKGFANSINGLMIDKDALLHHQHSSKNSSSSPSQWTRVRQHGKSYKELTGLYMCQEIQAHQGSIWCIRFSHDARFLASAGEDRVIHVWEVIECDVLSSKPLDEGNSTPVHPMASHSHEQPPLAETPSMPSERKRRGKVSSSSRKGKIPDYIVVPDTVFSLTEKPVCSFHGHLDDVLDLSWSKSQQLLSSSMDKTVRLWDMESKSCLKLFAHNDYVTCIDFNPVDDTYFISGSLDAKVRIWSIPDRHVVDWTDLHEMVTAVCYTPDGQGAMVGSHKGTCRLYDTSESKLVQKEQITVQTKKKSQAKKITGFEFDPGNPSEVLITSADSRIRVFDGSTTVQKFRGFRNTNSQISAAFTADGKYVICASEDSQIYIWKRDELRNVVAWKNKGFVTTQSHEHFQCKDVSIAIPWPGCIKHEPPLLSSRSKRYSSRSPSHGLPSPGASTEEIISPSTTNKKKDLPPLPKKSHSISERAASCPEEDLDKPSRVDSGISDSTSFSSTTSSFKFGHSPSISASSNCSSSSSRWCEDGNNHHRTAWGMVIVTAGLGGELRIYQNFGLPLRLRSQIHLFRDHSSNPGSGGGVGNLSFR
ncbi:WD40 repeat [Macleaya cordata]|uniref:WD40 repeat n=1 Tax=Macleaya cordata TaxID=56857 RepID=A0A200QP61_MACCD|nr:WD40 repeat [Macleaya cordata]